MEVLMRAMLLAAILVLTACDSQPPKTRGEINQIIRLADAAMGVLEKTGQGAPEADVREAMEEMTVALDAARDQIHAITQRVGAAKYYGRGSIDPIDISSCIDASLLEAASIAHLPVELLSPWLSSLITCTSKTDAYLTGASGEDAAAVALAVSALFPISLVAQAKAGFEAVPSLQRYRSANEAIVATLASTCGKRDGGGTEQVHYKCAAYEVAMSVQPKLEALAARLPKSS
jgi:hypothetical protein